jgi:hypothetical protein
MRNFWVVTEADGLKTVDATGPKSSGGGFTTDVYVKEGGRSVKKVAIRGVVEGGNLIVEVRILDPEELVERVVKR